MPGNNLLGFLPMIVILALFYFMIIRPQQKHQKEAQNMRNSIQVGDQIITIGGIIGKIIQVKDDIVVIEVGSQKSSMEILKSAIGSVTKKKDIAEAVINDSL